LILLVVAVCGIFAVENRIGAAPYYLPTTGYAPPRYYLGAPNYYGYYYRPWYLSPFRYSYYAAKHGWIYPRYLKPYHPYPLGPWYGGYGPYGGYWPYGGFGPYGGYGPWSGFGGYASSGPVVVSAEAGEVVPPAVRFAGCDYW
jgi:hypothetical protein